MRIVFDAVSLCSGIRNAHNTRLNALKVSDTISIVYVGVPISSH